MLALESARLGTNVKDTEADSQGTVRISEAIGMFRAIIGWS